MPTPRTARIDRRTAETQITVEVDLDGSGRADLATGVPFLDHMLSLMSRHGLFDIKLRAKGDIDVDYHHTVEDVGIVLGKAVKQALGDMKQITRYGHASVPMDEAIAVVRLDISGRPYLVYKVEFPRKSRIKNFDADLIEDFLQACVGNSSITLHVESPYGRNIHHIIEAIFKAFAVTLSKACAIDPRKYGVPSTKGIL